MKHATIKADTWCCDDFSREQEKRNRTASSTYALSEERSRRACSATYCDRSLRNVHAKTVGVRHTPLSRVYARWRNTCGTL